MRYSPLLTDLYELTMLAGYVEEGLADQPAVFDLFFRTNPYQGGYAIFAGLEPALDYLENLRLQPEELAYLAGLKLFKPAFLDFLRDFRFRGRVTAPPEGTVVFANAPLLTVEGTLAEAQFVETALLNIVNFQTLVATKAARIVQAAGGATVLEFGLRRAQGPDGGLSVARAACVGGVTSTSNVLAGMVHGLPLRGTHAHSWVMAFPDELAAFRAYAAAFPAHCTLLIDTYDTLNSGIPHALTVAAELRARGYELQGVRIDSGDLAFLSRAARQRFDAAGFPDVRIVASNDLDEFVIDSIRDEGGAVDIYGVGTRLATCAGAGGGALGGVYKLVECAGLPRLKVTGDIAKATLPGKKRLLRALDADGRYLQDVLALAEDDPLQPGDLVFDPSNPLQYTLLPDTARLVDIRQAVMIDGRRTRPPEPLAELARRCRRELELLPQGCRRFINPHRYKVSLSPTLNRLRTRLIAGVRGERRAEESMSPSVALLLVDVQNDFCPGGALAVSHGDRVVAPLTTLAARFAAAGRPVFASRDWHPPQTRHFADYGGVWPVHCVADTVGAAFHPQLQLPASAIVLTKGDDPERDDYSAFVARDRHGTPLSALLHQAGIRQLCVGGLATDYCVRATVLDALAAGVAVTIVDDAIAGVDLAPGDSDRALAEMRVAGAQVRNSSDL